MCASRRKSLRNGVALLGFGRKQVLPAWRAEPNIVVAFLGRIVHEKLMLLDLRTKIRPNSSKDAALREVCVIHGVKPTSSPRTWPMFGRNFPALDDDCNPVCGAGHRVLSNPRPDLDLASMIAFCAARHLPRVAL